MALQCEAHVEKTRSLHTQLIALGVLIQDEHIPPCLQKTSRECCHTLVGYERRCQAADEKDGKHLFHKDSILYEFYGNVSRFLARLRNQMNIFLRLEYGTHACKYG